jgi:hypothetical protein
VNAKDLLETRVNKKRGNDSVGSMFLSFAGLIGSNGCMKKTSTQEDCKNLLGSNSGMTAPDSGLNKTQASCQGHLSGILKKLGKKE